MLYLIGLGLGDAKDISVKGLEVVKSASKVFLEAYTSILTVGKDELEAFYGREVTLADRTLVEQEADTILEEAATSDVVFLVVGDPFGATTHTDLVIRAKEKQIPYKVIHNASILNAAGCSGLQLYNFGETVSIVLWNDDWQPDSFYDKIISNKTRGLHTLCLLDIKVKEQTIENMMRGRKIYEPARYLTASAAITQILEVTKKRKQLLPNMQGELGRNQTNNSAWKQQSTGDSGDDQTNDIIGNDKTNNGTDKNAMTLDEDTMCVALARVGWNNQQILSGNMSTVRDADLGPPIHSLIVPGDMHFLEVDMLKMFAVNVEEFHSYSNYSRGGGTAEDFPAL